MKDTSNGFTRRDFLGRLGTTALTAAALRANGASKGFAESGPGAPQGPGPVPVTLTLNGTRRTFPVEPRVTLLDLLRGQAALTGAKEACGRATCGACTVLLRTTPAAPARTTLAWEPAYACMILAIDVQDHEVLTIEGVSHAGLTPLQQRMVEADALQCGFCTPGFVMSLTALLSRNPHPTEADIRKACSGHLCRCGSYPHIFQAALRAAGTTSDALA